MVDPILHFRIDLFWYHPTELPYLLHRTCLPHSYLYVTGKVKSGIKVHCSWLCFKWASWKITYCCRKKGFVSERAGLKIAETKETTVPSFFLRTTLFSLWKNFCPDLPSSFLLRVLFSLTHGLGKRREGFTVEKRIQKKGNRLFLKR